jgi:hypothetical protein
VFPRDTTTATPLCEETEFAELLAGMVADEAPRLFAVVQELGERKDGRIAAWGMAFADRAEVVSVRPGLRLSLESADSTKRSFTVGDDIRARVVWLDGDAAPHGR